MPKPNVLLITVDHWPAHLLAAAGHRSILTPTLDDLAASGVRFTNAYSECPVCVPARRCLMTGLTPRSHGDRRFQSDLPMPKQAPTLAQCFRDAGYQATAVGKLHVHPPRNRIGFDEVILSEEGRVETGVVDDYDMFLADRGHVGQAFAHGMGNNIYTARPWHLPEDCHVTNWATQQMARTIKRRDPQRPAFWYLSYVHPHPPLVPLQAYLHMYPLDQVPLPAHGQWTRDPDTQPPAILEARRRQGRMGEFAAEHAIRLARQAFYALCTHIDHQLRLVIGTLREEKLLDHTIICFTSDHGDMLGEHGLWAKRLFYEPSANIPMLLLGPRGDARTPAHTTDNRLVALRDVMPTLLDLAGLEIPASVEGHSMVADHRRELLYGEIGEVGPGAPATRMMHDGRHKLIYYPEGNHIQLFDLEQDPGEAHDLSQVPSYAPVRQRLTDALVRELYGGDEAFVADGRLIGAPACEPAPLDRRALQGQRGVHYPMP